MTDEDKILRKLGRLAEEDEMDIRVDARWDDYSAGRLSDAQIEQLRREAAGSPELIDAFGPLDEQFRADVVDRILDSEAGAQRPANVVALRPRRKRWVSLALAASLVLAIGAGLLIRSAPQIAALPGYTAQLRGGATLRSEPRAVQDTVRFAPGDRFELLFTPQTATDAQLEIELWRITPTGAEPVAAPAPEVSPQGAARLRGRIGEDIALPVGEYPLLVIVSRSGSSPGAQRVIEELAVNGSAEQPQWSAQRFMVRVEP